jgi:hypothetical protein
MESVNLSSKKTATGIVLTGQGVFRGMLLGTDGVNDPVVTIYDGLDNSGTEIIPTATYDASALGLNGVIGKGVYCETGIYVEITCAGTVEVVVEYTPYYPPGHLKWRG